MIDRKGLGFSSGFVFDVYSSTRVSSMHTLLISDRRSTRSQDPRALSVFCTIAVMMFSPLAAVYADEFTSELRSAAKPVEVTIGQEIVISGPQTQQNDAADNQVGAGQIATTDQNAAAAQDNATPDQSVVIEDASAVQATESSPNNSEIGDEAGKEEIATDSISQAGPQAEDGDVSADSDEITASADAQNVGLESVGETVVEVADESVGPSEELQEVIEVLHASAESAEKSVEASSETASENPEGSFVKIMESNPYDQGSPMVETQEIPSPSDLAVAESMIAEEPSLQDLRRQRAAEIARLRALRLQQQIRSGYSPLRPRWNAIPMMSSRYTRPVVYVPIYVR